MYWGRKSRYQSNQMGWSCTTIVVGRKPRPNTSTYTRVFIQSTNLRCTPQPRQMTKDNDKFFRTTQTACISPKKTATTAMMGAIAKTYIRIVRIVMSLFQTYRNRFYTYQICIVWSIWIRIWFLFVAEKTMGIDLDHVRMRIHKHRTYVRTYLHMHFTYLISYIPMLIRFIP